jgi:hypothetical protein
MKEAKETESKNIVVSDKFIEIYKNFNVVTQIESMKALSKRELYLLLILCLDKHVDEDPVIKFNMAEFKEECMKIFDIQDDKETTDADLLNLIEETGDKYIETDNIVDSRGEKLPDALTKEEVRDAKINIINE